MTQATAQSTPPLVSVLMTSYNSAKHLEATLRSVFAQTYPALELVVVDDGSTDDSRACIEQVIADAPFPVETLWKENGGQASALNAGFALCKGEIVALLDGDDLWVPEKIATMVNLICNSPGGGVYQHQVDNGHGAPLRKVLLSGDLMDTYQGLGEVNFLLHPHLVQSNSPTSGLCFRRAVLEEILPIPEQLVVCPDYYLFILGLTQGPLYSHPTMLGTWCSHEDNAGKEGQYSFKRYWLPTLLPVVNEALAARGIGVRLCFKRSAILWEPVRLLREILGRKVERKTRPRIE